MSLLTLWFLCWSLMVCPAVSYDFKLCWPKLLELKTWTLQVTHTDQGPDVQEISEEISMDVLGQRMAVRETGVRSGKEYDTFYLYYYPAHTLFTVEDGRCTTEYIDGQVLDCKVIPDDQINEYMVKTVLGFYSNGMNDALPIIALGRVDPSVGIGEFYMTDIRNNFPVMDEVWGNLNGGSVYQVTYCYNATAGIRDPAIFTPPEICLKH